jgi:uncharacterized membrane-anchored protein YhcB (DUF1043 family)
MIACAFSVFLILNADVVAGISIGLIILNILARLVSQTRERVLEELKEKDKEV